MNSFFQSHWENLLVNFGHFVDHMTPVYHCNRLFIAKTLVKTIS